MNEFERSLPSELGAINIADEVVSTIAGMAAMEVDGVTAMSGGIVGGIAEALGKKNLGKGVKVEVGAEETIIEMSLVVRFGARIPDVAWKVQEKVKTAIERMTGLRVLKVNINVQGVQFPQKESAKDSDDTIVR